MLPAPNGFAPAVQVGAKPAGRRIMGFDKDDTRPLIRPERRTTKVNLWMVAGILLFFVAAGVLVWILARNPAAASP